MYKLRNLFSHFFSNFSSDTVIATASMLVACFSFFFTVYQVNESRRIERLRFKPILKFDMGKRGDWGFWVTLKNYGLGTADIKYFIVSFENEVVSDWVQLMQRSAVAMGGGLPNTNLDSFRVPLGYITPEPNESDDVIFRESDPAWRDLLWSSRDRMKFVVCSCSLLGECSISIWSQKAETILVPECNQDADSYNLFSTPKGF